MSKNTDGSRLVLPNMVWAICKIKRQPSLKAGNWQRVSCVLQQPGPKILAHWLVSGSDAFGKKQAITTGSGPVLHNTIFGRMELNRMREVSPAHTIQPDSRCMLAMRAITGCNQNASQSDLACLLRPSLVSDQFFFLLLIDLFPWIQFHLNEPLAKLLVCYNVRLV